jgi:hypothetical protein
MNFNPYQNYGAGIAALGPVQAMSDRNEAQTYMANGGQMYASGGIARLAEGGLDSTKNALDKYKYDPVTQRFTLQGADEATTAMEEELLKNKRAAEAAGRSGSLSKTFESENAKSPWDSMNSTQRAAYYDANPNMGKVTRGLMGVLGSTGLGAALKYFNPQGWGEADAISRGFDPKDTSFGRERTFFGLLPGREAIPKPGVDVYGYGNGTMDTNYNNSLAFAGTNWTPTSSGDVGLTTQGEGFRDTGYRPSESSYYSAPSESGPLSGASWSNSDSSGSDGAANGGLMSLARGGMSHLGDYSDGGRLLRGPGNGTSDSIPATIADKRPARLADGEFVIPSRIVSELGNGSTEAGARQLYAMMDRIQKARAKTVGKNKVAVDAKARNQLPA